MDALHVLLVIGVLLVCFIGSLLDDEESKDPLDLARPALERLDAEAKRASKELRQLDRGGR